MKRAFIVFTLLLCVALPAMASLSVVQVQNNFSSALGTALSVTISSTSGNLLVAWVRHGTNNTSSISVSDNLSQTWSQAGSNCNSTTSDLGAMWYIPNSGVVSSVTATFGGSVNNESIIVYEVSGAATSSPLDAVAACASNASNVTSLTSGTITTTNANDILFYGVNVGANQSGAAWVAGAGYTLTNNNDATGASSTNTRAGMQNQIVAATQSGVTTSITWSSAANAHGLIAAFKAAGGAVTTRPPTQMSLGVGK